MWEDKQRASAKAHKEECEREAFERKEVLRKQYMGGDRQWDFLMGLTGSGKAPKNAEEARRFLTAPTDWEFLRQYQEPEVKRLLRAAWDKSQIMLKT